MKEININIEGYNVNGICVGCLNYNRAMYYNEDIHEIYKLLGNIDVPDGLSIQVCWECLAAVKSAKKFQEQILRSYDKLIKYSLKHTFLNSPEDLSQHAVTNLSLLRSCTQDVTGIEAGKSEEFEVQVKAEDELEDFEIKPKVEDDFIEDNNGFIYDDQQTQDYDDDDDVILSLLKTPNRKKEKRKKRTKVKIEEEKMEKMKRKLKNLPENQVDIYNMTEEEMWTVRSQDQSNENFLKLKYKCKDCVIGFNTEKLMKYHLYNRHKQKSKASHQCDVCLAYFLTRDNLAAHRALHLGAFRCRSCGFRSGLKLLMLQHVRAHDWSAELWRCATCHVTFSTKSRLTYHRTICSQEKPQCDCCGKVFANKMTLKYHLKVLPQKKDDKPKEKLYLPCKGCGKVFNSKKSYRSHVVVHEGLSYPCPTCGKLFRWKRNLARHTRNHRERAAGRSHACRDCGKTFSSRDCYHNHMRLSKRHAPSDAYSHQCNFCGKKFSTKCCLTDHIDWDHLKKIKYECDVCFKAFKTAKILVVHKNNIHGNKQQEVEGEHLCEKCGKSYKTVKRLKGHVSAMHTNRSTSKSFKCKLCPATFIWQTSIYKHMKMMHESDVGTARKQLTKKTVEPMTKQESAYPEIELTDPMQYYQPNVSAFHQGTLHVQTIGHNIGQN